MLATFILALRDAGIPASVTEHLALLRACPLHWSAGDYLFVHAGIRPEVPLEAQDPFDLIWIREPFLSFDGELPLVVVHGHTPTATPSSTTATTARASTC